MYQSIPLRIIMEKDYAIVLEINNKIIVKMENKTFSYALHVSLEKSSNTNLKLGGLKIGKYF